MTEDKPSVGSAYALEGKDEVRALYRDWARTYDSDFVERMSYVLPGIVARVFLRHQGVDNAPILDIGCGSGAVGLELAGLRVDGIDLSAEMLQVATEKGVYTRLIEADLLGVLPIETGSYGGLVSAGTFTHGHVGPDAVPELLRVAAPGALFCLAVNAEHYGNHGFEAAFNALEADGSITALTVEDHPIYEADHDHAKDRSRIVTFRRGA